MNKIIKTEQDYESALQEAKRLVAIDPDPGTEEADKLELLVHLIEAYEKIHYPMPMPDPISAIEFRMDQQGLKQKDLIPYIGSKSKVSEVLSGKQPLTLRMIRNLHSGLGIPLEILVGKDEPAPSAPELEWKKFPLKEMLDRGWLGDFKGTLAEAKKQAGELLNNFFKGVDLPLLQEAFLRQSVRSSGHIDPHALMAWKAQALKQAGAQTDVAPYPKGRITRAFITDVARLSYFDQGPGLVEEYLAKSGIHFVIVPHLSKTHLDGAVMRDAQGAPVIALTLRHDRLDNFWFTLAHELAHLALHMDKEEIDCIIDDLDAEGDSREQAADTLAREALLPARAWASLQGQFNKAQIQDLAAKLRIHPAIIAGRVRYESKNYSLLSDLIGSRQVNRIFDKQ